MPENASRKYAINIDYLADFPGADIASDSVRVESGSILSVEDRSLQPHRSTPVHDFSGTVSANSYTEIYKSGMNGYSAIVVTVKATYDESATAGVRVRWLYSPDGVNYDSPEDAEAQGNYEDLTVVAGDTRQRTILIPIFADSVRIQIVNLDNSAGVTVDVWSWLLR